MGCLKVELLGKGAMGGGKCGRMPALLVEEKKAMETNGRVKKAALCDEKSDRFESDSS